MKKIFGVLVALVLLFGAILDASAASVKRPTLKQSRCISDESAWRSAAQTGRRGGWMHDPDTFLDNVYRMGANCVEILVWDGSGTLGWKSTDPLLIQSPGWTGASFYTSADPATRDDILTPFIRKAHALGIEVHGWTMVSKRQTNLLFPDNPEWVDDRVGGTFKAWNMNQVGIRNKLIAMQKEMFERFDLDGSLQDYERTQQDEDPVLNRADMLDYMRKLNRVARGVKGKNFIITCYGLHELGDGAFYRQGRDINKWGNENLCDVFWSGFGSTTTPYTDNSSTLRRYFEGRQLQIYPDKTKFGVNAIKTDGPGTTYLDVDDFIYNVREAHSLSEKNGVSIYFYDWISDEMMAALRGTPEKPGPWYEDAVPHWGK